MSIKKFPILGFSFLLLLTLFSRADAAIDPTQRALVHKVDRQLACDCGCSLTVDDCRVSMTCSESERLEKEVTGFVKAGLDEKSILAKMREKYGESILAAPTKEGFNITAWTFPFLALLFGGFVATYYLRKWKSEKAESTEQTGPRPKVAKIEDDYDRRIEDELKDFDA